MTFDDVEQNISYESDDDCNEKVSDHIVKDSGESTTKKSSLLKK